MNAQPRAVSDRTVSRLLRTELERRWALVRQELKTRDIDALVVLSCEDFLGGHVRWLTDRPAYSGNNTVALFYANDLMTLIEHGPSGRKRTFAGEEPDYPGVGQVINAAAFQSARATHRYEAEFALAELKLRGYRRIALAGSGVMPYAFVDALMDAGLEIHDLTDFMDICRARKSAYELDLVRKTAAMQDRILAHLLEHVRPGMRDMDVVTHIMSEGRREGSEQAVFLAGSAPAGVPAMMRPFHYQGRVIGHGDSLSVLIENNGPEGYYTELGRTIVFGAASAELKDGLETVREAQRETVRQYVPGTPCADIARAHDRHMQERGLPLEERLYAHGQGYSLVERPLIRADETMRVEAGMCLVAHPAYIRGGVFAYICDNFIVHDSGPAEPIHSTEQKVFEV
jgi:Xaa-Pro aminopeptidase